MLPFSEQARQAAQNVDFTIDAASIQSARQFVGLVVSRAITDPLNSNDLAEVKKLALCKVILSMCPYPIIARFADNYSLLWKKYFNSNPKSADDFARELFPSIVLGDKCTIPVFEYLAAEESIAMIDVSSGVVILSRQELTDTLRRQVKRRVLSIPSSGFLPTEVKSAAESLAKEFAAFMPKGAKNLEKEEIRQIRSGVAEGGRFYGCMKLSRACFRDGLSLEEAKQIILEYVKACAPGKTPFTEKEALTCLEWLYRKGQRVGEIK